MIRLSHFPPILILFLSFQLSAQVDAYIDRVAWQSAVNGVCYTEDLNSFTQDTNFRTTPLQLNGFSIVQSSGTDGFRNEVDAPPLFFADTDFDGTSALSLFVEGDEPREVTITFDEPVCGFFADYMSSSQQEVLMEVYNSTVGMIDSFTHNMNSVSRGVVSTDPSMPITMIVMSAASSEGSATGQGFGMDNIEIACDCTPAEPIPTMGEWGFISLGLCMLILGVVAVGRRVAAAG